MTIVELMEQEGNPNGISPRAKQLMLSYLYYENPAHIAPVIEAIKDIFPNLWVNQYAGGLSARVWSEFFDYAYQLGKMEGKREERAKHHKANA